MRLTRLFIVHPPSPVGERPKLHDPKEVEQLQKRQEECRVAMGRKHKLHPNSVWKARSTPLLTEWLHYRLEKSV